MRTVPARSVIAALVLVAALAGCGGGDDVGGEGAGGGATSTEGQNAYPQESIDAFMSSCMDAGGTESECRCAIDSLQEQVSFEEFERIDEAAREGRPTPKIVRDVIEECAE